MDFKLISDPVEFQHQLAHLRSAAFVSARLPAQVFRDQFGRYQFLEFDLFSDSKFWWMLQLLMEASTDQSVTVMVLDPEPERSFEEFGRYGVLVIPASASAHEYGQALAAGPGPSPADALEYSAEVILWVPPSLSWLIWAERETEMMVLAYRFGFEAPSTEILTAKGTHFFSAEDALDISSAAWRDRAARMRFSRELLDNYGKGQPWKDPALSRALEIARKVISGEVGTIEGCRALSAVRHEMGSDLGSLFLTFTAVDTETDDLPIGPVRAEWAPRALALKDLQIARCEKLYRPQVIDACAELIKRLDSIAHSC